MINDVLIYKNAASKDYYFIQRKRVLTNNICSSFLPISIIEDNDIVKSIVHCKGYRRLSEYFGLNIEKCFYLLEKIIEKLEVCREYLIFPEDMILNINTIYVSYDFNDVRFVYIPEDRIMSEQMVFVNIISSMAKAADKTAEEYLAMLGSQLMNKRLTSGRMIALLHDIEKEYKIVSGQ